MGMNEPEPATPTVAAPAPMNLAAESISRVTAVVWNDRTCGKSATGVVFWAANVWLWQMTALLNGRKYDPLVNCLEEEKNIEFCFSKLNNISQLQNMP